jgi:hypothetical protein
MDVRGRQDFTVPWRIACPLLVLADQLAVWFLSFASPSWSKNLSQIEHNRRILWTG